MNNPNLFALGAVIAGIITSVRWPLHPAGWLLGGLLCLTWLAWRYQYFSAGWLLLSSLVLLAGFICSSGRVSYSERLCYNQRFVGQTLAVEGRLIRRPEPTDWGVRLELALKKYRNHPRGKVTVYWRGGVAEDWVGRELRVVGRFRKVQANKETIPDFYERRQLTGVIVSDRPPVLLHRPFNAWLPSVLANRLRLEMAAVARKRMTPLNWQVLQGMLFGAELREEGAAGAVLEAFRRTGTVHLLSVSGLHVGFVVAGLAGCLSWCGLRGAGRIPWIILGVGFYALMTGMEPPVLRSGIMLVLYLIAGQLQTGDEPLNRLGLAAVILLLFNPYHLFEIGFQLSFTATAGVVGLYPVLKEYFPVKVVLLKPVWHTFLISVAAQVVVLPLLVCYFYQISWIGPVANLLLAIPALLIVLGGLAGELIGLALPGAARILLTGVDWLISGTMRLMQLCARPGWAATGSPPWPWPWLAGYYLGLVLLIQALRPNLLTGRRIVNYGWLTVGGLLALNLVVWTGCYLKTGGGCLEVAVIDVGQGDAVFLRTPDHYTVLVDGGEEGRGRNRVLPFLRQQGISHLDLVLGSHGHQDHLGGLDEVLQNLPVGILYVPGRPNRVTRKLTAKLKWLRLTGRSALPGLRFRWGRYVFARTFQLPDAAGENDRSTVLLVGYGKYRLLLTGDLSSRGEEILVDRYPQLLKATVLKVGHHGSDYASTWKLLSQVKPRIAVISVGSDNRFGHPGQTALNRLRSLGTDIYRTDWHGTVRIRLYPDRILVIPDKVAQ